MDSYKKKSKYRMQERTQFCILNQMVFSNIELENRIDDLEKIVNRQNLLSFNLGNNQSNMVLNQLSSKIMNNSFLILILLQNQRICIDEYLNLSNQTYERGELHG